MTGQGGGGAAEQAVYTPISLAEARLAKLKAIPFDRSKYEVVRDLARLKAWIVRAIDVGQIAIDTQTSSLDPMQATLCGFSLAVTPNEACYVPVAHRQTGEGEGLFDAGLVPHQISETDAIDAMRPLFEDKGVLKIGHNLKFDWQIFAQRGIDVAPYDDTMLMSYVVDSGRVSHDVAVARDAQFRSHRDRLQRDHQGRQDPRHLRLRADRARRRICRRRRRRHACGCGMR